MDRELAIRKKEWELIKARMNYENYPENRGAIEQEINLLEYELEILISKQ